jgi:hypothetical protein
MIDGLMGVKTDKGTVVFVCAKCGRYPDNMYGTQNKAELVYVLMCEKCGKVVGEWATVEQREEELRAFAAKVKLLT